MTMIKRFSTYMLALMSLAACSDDFNAPVNRLEEDGRLSLSFSLAQLQTVTTRANDNLSSVSMYVYDQNGAKLMDEDLTVASDGSASVMLNNNVLSNRDNARFYFFANAGEITGSLDTSVGIESATVDKLTDGSNFTLSSKGSVEGVAYYSLGDLTSAGAAVNMVHNAVKVTVTEGEGANKEEYGAGSVKYPFATIGTAGSSKLLAGGMGAVSDPVDLTNSRIDATELNVNEEMVHPTNNTTNGNANKSFVIVKAKYENIDYYYRLDFQMVEGEGDNAQTKAIDLKPNHWYQFLIKSVNGPGYSKPSEAAANPTPMVEYAIHDHAPVIYNMISDGMRELGVSEGITNYNKTPHSDASPNLQKVSVKLFSPIEEEMDELTMENWTKYIIIPRECDWLEVSAISLASESDHGTDGFDESYNEDGVEAGHKNSKGKVYDVTLKFKDTRNPGTQETDITVNWHGLSRNIHVVWNRDFDPSKLFSPDVKIKAFDGENHSWNDPSEWNNGNSYIYFKQFLGQGLDDGAGLAVGTSTTQNNGMTRNAGLHFPLMYGADNADGTFRDKWTYMYEISINPDVADGEDFTWTISAEGVSNVKFTQADGRTEKTSGNKNDRVFYVTRSNKRNSENKVDDWNYEVGTMHIYVTVGNAEPVDYPIDLYHTGFFHQDQEESNCVKGGVSGKYTYYEVVTVGDDHWLDRNIGAKSAEMYIEGGYGPAEAAGYYIVGAQYVMYGTPKMYESVTPPGYEAPSVEQWNSLRLSPNFHSELSGAYYNAYYQTNLGITANNSTPKRVYFPKGRYYEGTGSSSLIGNARSGYYWTRDAATGTEKEEIGNWLRCLTITGSSTSFISGRVQGRSNPYYMSMRAVAKRLTNSSVTRFSFQVEGATHVYLYSVDENGDRTAATTWPGQAIGNSYTMTIGQSFPFSYESKTASRDNLYVIFNYVDEKGRIYTMSNNDFADDAAHYSIKAKDANGWLVYGSQKSTDFGKTNCGVDVNTTYTGETTTWVCSAPFNNEKYKFRIYWPNDLKYNNADIGFIHVWTQNGENVSYSIVWGTGKGKSSEIDGYVAYDFEMSESELNNNFGYKFCSVTSSESNNYNAGRVRDVFGDNKRALNVAWIGSSPNEIHFKERPAAQQQTVKYRLYWRRQSSDDNTDGNYWKVEVYDGENNSLIASKTDEANWEEDGGWYYIDFTIKDYAENLSTRSIRPEFYGGTGKRYVKTTDGGKISLGLSGWENSKGTYIYGKTAGQLTEKDISPK